MVARTFELLAELLALHIENRERVQATTIALLDERRTAEMREQFIAVLGHDLCNPLAAPTAGTSALTGTKLDRSGRKVVHLMHESCKRIIELTTDILDFARGKLGGGVPLRVAGEPALGAIFNHVIDELRMVHPEREIRVEIDISDCLFCDSSRLAELLSNPLTNALTHGDPELAVDVTVRDDGTKLIIAVANSGAVIPRHQLASLFHPFARGAEGPRDGLGRESYIASEIAKAHGGSLNATSTDKRTIFTARMPSRQAAQDKGQATGTRTVGRSRCR